MKNAIIISALLLASITSCKNQPVPASNDLSKPADYIVLLDLSDRILQSNQAERDIDLVLAVFSEFDSRVRKNLVINSCDKFQIIIAPQKGVKYDAQGFENALYLDMSALNPGNKINALVNFGNDLKNKLNNLYSVAHVGNKTSDYLGAAIWQFFNEQLEVIARDKYENHLIILTDGYFDLENYDHQLASGNRYPTTSFLSSVRGNITWKESLEKKDMGLLPVNKNFRSLQVTVAEIFPKYDFQYEADMLSYVWSKWCSEMSISDFEMIPHTSLPQSVSLLKEKIKTF